MERSENCLNQFDSFDAGRWEAWIQAALSGNHPMISPERDEGVADYAIRVYKSIPIAQKDIFTQVLSHVVTHCPYLESHAKRWFDLLRISQVVKPPVKDVLRTALATGFGKTPVSVLESETTLEANLLLTAAKYGVDEWLLDYIWRSSELNSSFVFSLLCTRILSWRLDISCLAYHSVLIPRMTEAHHAAQYSPECYLVLKRLGCRNVMNWLHTFVTRTDQFAPKSFKLWSQSFEEALLRHGDDSYAIAMLAELRARSSRFDSKMLYRLSRVSNVREPDLIPNLMLRIKPIVGWEYEDPQELAVPPFAFRHAHEFRSKSFNIPLTPGSPEFELIDRTNLIASKQNISQFSYTLQPSSIIH